MRDVISILGVILAIIVFVIILRSASDSKVNFYKEHRESIAIAIIPMVLFLIITYYVLSHVGL